MALPLSPRAFRASILHFRGDPGRRELRPTATNTSRTASLVVEDGRVARARPGAALLATLPREVPRSSIAAPTLIVPGFIDAHIHYSQTDVIACAGRNCCTGWSTYTFPEEARFADPRTRARSPELFLDELLRHGTTTAMVFCTVHRASVDAFFAAARGRNLRMVGGQGDDGPQLPRRRCATPRKRATRHPTS